MSEENKPDLKKNLPNTFIWFLMAAFILALMVQNFIETKFASVSFSYQLEHLVNLQLIQPEESRKTALNDNLVTFSGKFRDRLTEEGKNRYKFLELLNNNHHLIEDKNRLDRELTAQRVKIIDSADLFLHLSGASVPPKGYVVIDDLLGTGDDQNRSIIIRELSPKSTVSLPDLKKEYLSLAAAPTEESVKQYGASVVELIRNFRSPALGIGNETIKQALRNLDQEVANANMAK